MIGLCCLWVSSGRWRVALLGLVLGLTVVSCGRDDRPDLVLVTVDTLRADHLGCYGYPRDTSPFLDDLARNGVVFDNAVAASSTTVPSHATILSGLHPTQHGARANGERVRSGVRTLAQTLQSAGYRTASFVSTTAHFAAAGLDQGFDHFEDPGLSGGKTGTFQSVETVRHALEWLSRGNDHRPLFLWIHLWDPHSPYRPDQLITSGGGDDDAPFVEYMVEERCVDAGFFDDDSWRLRAVMDSYDGEVRAVDDALHTLYDGLHELRDRRAVWIVTSDHGEGLGQHDWLLHGRYLYREQIHVPLIVHSTAGEIVPSRISTPVGHIDLFPTLLEIGPTSGEGVQRPCGGRSLMPLLEGQGSEYHGITFSERRRFSNQPPPLAFPEMSDPGVVTEGCELYEREDLRQAYIRGLIRADLAHNFEIGDAYAVSDERYTLIHRTALGDQFFDRLTDPCELKNLIADESAAEARLRTKLDAILAALASSTRSADLIDPEEIERLKALGYTP